MSSLLDGSTVVGALVILLSVSALGLALGAFKLRFARDLSMDQLELKINDLESRLRSEFPHLRRIYIEPGFDESKHRDKGHM